ncbi:MAG: restriction endonuclease subunit S [Cetobacterium sp.]
MNKIPKLRFPEFSGEWEEKEVGKAMECIVPGRNKPENFDGEIPWITTPDISNKDFIYRSKNNLGLSKEEIKKVGAKIVPKNSVIMSCVGELGIVSIAGTDIVINQQLHAFIPNEKINSIFVKNVLLTKLKYMQMVATKTALLYMNKETCNSIPFFYPSLPEQEEIASFLSSVDSKIEKLERKKELWEQYKKGMMQKIFSQELRFKDENGEDYPEWEEKSLGEVCEINKGKQLNKTELEVTGEYPVINGGVLPSGYTDEYNTSKDTITISEGGNSCGYINFIKQNFWSGGHCYTLNLKSSINNQLLYQLLKYNEKNIMSLRVGSGLPNIQKKDIIPYQIYISSLPEQNQIADFLSSIDSKIEIVEKELIGMKEFKKGLLQKMFV